MKLKDFIYYPRMVIMVSVLVFTMANKWRYVIKKAKKTGTINRNET
jgi:hypothetical protein